MVVQTGTPQSRAAVLVLFTLIGFTFAAWVSNIPTIQARTDVSHSLLGTLLLVLGVGQVSGMQVAGWLAQRYGSRLVCAIGAVSLAITVNLPGLATSPMFLAVSLLLFGTCYGLINIAANDQAVLVEQAYGRPIMASFHALFSIGGAAGAGLTAIVQAAGMSVHWPLAIASAATLLLGVWALPRLVAPGAPQARHSTDHPSETATTAEPPRPGVRRQVFTLALLAFLLMLAEGAAYDWSALQAVEHMGQTESSAAFAYGTFALAMTAGRLSVDRVVARIGPVTTVRIGSTIAVVGLTSVVLAPVYPLTLAGWFIFGLGLSGIVPQVFSAAGNLPVTRRAVVLSRIVGTGFVGLLAGPAVIGWLSEFIGLNYALILPAVFCIAGVVLAGAVARPQHKPSVR